VTYQLGIDIGTTFTAAAIVRDGQADPVELGDRTLSVPSVVFVTKRSETLVGDAAERRGVLEPDRLAREFKRRVGDSVSVLVGGAPFAPQTLMAAMLRWVVDEVTKKERQPPDNVVATFPANWGDYRRELFGQAVRSVVPDAELVPEPEAAAARLAAANRLSPGEVVAIYDLGGGTFDAAVLRKTPGGFTIIGTQSGVEHLGGADFDEAVLGHVRRALGHALDDADVDDPAVRTQLARLRSECVAAKEALSRDTEVGIPVVLPERHAQVRLHREEFESMIRPAVGLTVDILVRTIEQAGLSVGDVAEVVLIGGSSRIPLIEQLVTAAVGSPAILDRQPQQSVALGAALLGSARANGRGRTPAPEPPPQEEHAVPIGHSPPALDKLPGLDRRPWRPRRRVVILAACMVALLMVAAAVFLRTSPDRTASNRLAATLTGHRGDVVAVAFSPDGHVLATGSRDKSVKLWDVASGRAVATLTGHRGVVSAVAFSSDRRTVASGSSDLAVKLWNVAGRREVATLTGYGSVQAMAFSPDGRTLATGNSDLTVMLWDVATRRQAATLTGHRNGVRAVAFSPDGRTLASGAFDDTVKLWDVAGHRESGTLTGHGDDVLAVAFAPDGRILASGSWDETAKLWNVASGRSIATLTGHGAGVTAVAFSPDGRTLATGSWDTVRLWDVASRRTVATLTGHTGGVIAVAFSPDGRTLAVGSGDNTVRMWEVASHPTTGPASE